MIDNNVISLIQKDTETQSKINKALTDLNQVGLQGKADLCPQLAVNNIVKDKALLVMRDTLREQEMELEAYQKTLGRRLTEDEITQFMQMHSTPALFDQRDQKLLTRLTRNLARSKELTNK